MITNVKQLITECMLELQDRQYRKDYTEKIISYWNDLSAWMQVQSIQVFNEDVANRYCDTMIGTHLIVPDMALQDKHQLRSVRMLVSYQKHGEFEFRSPRVEYKFEGKLGVLILEFLDYAANKMERASSTIDGYRVALYKFLCYLETTEVEIDSIHIDVIQDFLNTNCNTIGARHSYSNTLRQFLRYLCASHYTENDFSVYVLPDNYNRHSSIPTTYTEDEIKRIIEGPDRSSAIGKRDYLILLLAGEYGWRSSDITHFCLNQIDWDNNIIRFEQHKTGVLVEFPLLSSVGNAIIDYLKHGRPESDCPQVILSAEQSQKVGPLKSSTIHSVVTRYIKKANITGWTEKKHGAHSLRHSLASNMLKRNTSLPVISTVLGHQNTETTKIYLKVDTENLRKCCIPMVELSSPYYRKVVRYYER